MRFHPTLQADPILGSPMAHDVNERTSMSASDWRQPGAERAERARGVHAGRDGSLNPPQLVDVAFGYGQPLRYLAGRAVAIMPLRRRRRTSLALRIIDPQTFPQEPRLFL